MAEPLLILFDDETARGWHPFTRTRPAGELLFGAMRLRERAERVFGARCAGHLTVDALRSYDEHDAPPALGPEAVGATDDGAGIASFTAEAFDGDGDASAHGAPQLPTDRDRIFLSSRAVPDLDTQPALDGSDAAMLTIDGRPCGWYSPAGEPAPSGEFLRSPETAAPDATPTKALQGRLLGRVWTLMTGNAEQIARDIVTLFPSPPVPELPAGAHRIGGHALVLGDGVAIEPGVVFDLRDGPVWLDDGVRVQAFSRIAGPAYIGPRSDLLGGPYEAITIGPVCKVRGEIEESVVLGFSNKAHAGFLGHAYLGRWVNLGATTTNSDLKNNYGSIRLTLPDGAIDTGETKLGCLLGDYVKTAIGTMLNTGTVIGPGANVFGGPPPKYVPGFAWGADGGAATYDRDRFIADAETMMARREIPLADGQRELLTAAWASAETEGW